MYTRPHPYGGGGGRGGYGTGSNATAVWTPEAVAAISAADVSSVATEASSAATSGLFDDPALEALQSRSLQLVAIADGTTEADITAACEPWGEVRQCILNRDKLTATVDFYDLRHAERARLQLKDNPINTKRVTVQYAVPKPRSDDKKDLNMGTLYVRPQGADRSFVDPNSVDSYKTLFGQYGELKKVSSNRKREAEKFIEYFDCRGSQKAQELLNGYNFNGVILEVQYAQQPSRTLNRDSRISDLVRGPYRRNQTDGYGPQRGHQQQQQQQPQQQQQWGYAAYGPANYWSGYGAWDYGAGAAAASAAGAYGGYGQYGAYGQQQQVNAYGGGAGGGYAQYGQPVGGVVAGQQQQQQQSQASLAAAAASYAAAMNAYGAAAAGGGVMQPHQQTGPGGMPPQ
eukprot:GHVS01108540.1.p1 GENE.GHVS01108540.1~~GHVS01108540.1.p1  ORF type:complete len:400 (+),score=96.15 GHVS01108540.1:214-1413(+)